MTRTDTFGVANPNFVVNPTPTANPEATAPLIAPVAEQPIEIVPTSHSFAHTTTYQLAAFLDNADGTVTDITSTATWTSSTGATATVDSAGLVTGVGAGTTTITAEHSNGQKATCAITCT